MKRMVGVLLALAACSLAEGFSVESVYRQTRSILEGTVEDAVPLLPTLPLGAPLFHGCTEKYQYRVEEIDISTDIWIEYEKPSEARSVLDAVRRSWEERGLDVAVFENNLTVYPEDEELRNFRLDAEIVPESRRIRLSADTVCLRPASGIPPTAISEIGGDPRDLRGPAAEEGATVRDAADWAGRILQMTALDAGAAPRALPPSGLVPCYQFGGIEPGPGVPRGLPDLFTADRDFAVDAASPRRILTRVRGAWAARGFEVESGEVGGGPTVVARFGDFAFRGRIDAASGRLFLHASTPCLPKRAG